MSTEVSQSAFRRFIRWPVLATGTLLLIPVILWLYALGRYAVNIPTNDDYALVEFLLRWLDPAATSAQRFNYLIAPHNTHQIVYDKLVALATYYLTGRLNFWLMTMLGNAALLAILWRLWTPFRQLNLPVWYFAPLPALLLNLQSHENMFWAMAALQNFTVIYFVFEALHQLQRWPASKASFAWAAGLSIAAVLTSGSGFLAFGVGALVLLHQRRWRLELPVWLAILALALAGRFLSAPVQEERTPMLGWLPKTALALSGLFTNSERATALLWGIGGLVLLALVVLGLSWLFRPKKNNQQPLQARVLGEWFSFAAVVVATALLIAMHRLPDEVLRDRYKIYSHLAVGLLYLVGIAAMRLRYRRFVAGGVTGAALLLNLLAFHSDTSKIVSGHQISQANAYNFSTYQTLLTLPYYQTDQLMRRSQALGVYAYPALFPHQRTWKVRPSPMPLSLSRFRDTTVDLSFIGYHPPVVQVEQRAFPRYAEGPAVTGLYVVLEADKGQRFLFPAGPARSGVLEFMTTGRLFTPGFTTSFYESTLPPGTYRVGLVQSTNRITTWFQTDQTFVVLPRVKS